MAKRKREQDEAQRPGGQPAPVGITARVEYHFPEGMVARYANLTLVQIGPMECQISFFEIRPPVILGTPEEIQEQARNVKTITAECVTRVVVAPEFLPTLIKALGDTWTQHQAKSGAQHQEPEKDKANEGNDGKQEGG